MSVLKLSELIGAFSLALDLTEGQPRGHCVRSCWIGMHIGQRLGLRKPELWALYYAILLKDLGCSSNAARICELYLTDDRAFKRDFKRVGSGLPLLAFVARRTAPHAGWRRRVAALREIGRGNVAHELIQTRCSRGADIARRLGFPEPVAGAVHALDEHFDGSGQPDGLRGDAIPLGARIALLAQVVDVLHFSQGPAAALAEARARSGRWFDPALVRALEEVARDAGFWRMLASPGIEAAVHALEPHEEVITVDEDYLDAIAVAFGEVVDAKSPFTAGHSARVGHYTDRVARELGIAADRRRWLWRAAMLHDVGKLGISNTILDKPGALTEQEWTTVQQHAIYTEQILACIPQFSELSHVAAAHHERLDGRGYPKGLAADEITLETRIITVADIFDAITAERPYHPPMPAAQGLDIMRAHLDSQIDRACFAALEQSLAEAPVGAEAELAGA